ncbi:MAG: hypothetical protein C4K49_06105 [Candidatus Thorarchaeota archaeon]|nr:MAG: hypothetical protein C4K49_06105 [Candidatus Thorarchaeota archaeon]
MSWVSCLTQDLRTIRATLVEVTSTKTVADLLHELNLSTDHVVLVDGQRLELDALVNENDRVVVLPLITGG